MGFYEEQQRAWDKHHLRITEKVKKMAPMKYAPLILDILKKVKDFEANEQDIEAGREIIEDIKDSLNEIKKDKIISEEAQELMECLDMTERSLDVFQKVSYLSKILIDVEDKKYPFETNKIFMERQEIQDSQELKDNILQSIKRNNVHLLNYMKNMTLAELKGISNFGKGRNRNIEKDLHMLLGSIIYIVNETCDEKLQSCTKEMNHTIKEKVISEAKKKFPGLGNNKFRFFENESEMKILDEKLKEFTKGFILNYMSHHLGCSIDEYKNVQRAFYDLAIIPEIILFKGVVNPTYKDITQEHFHTMLQEAHNRKFPAPITTKSSQKNITSIPEPIAHTQKKESPDKEDTIKEEIRNFIDTLCNQLTKSNAFRKELVKFFTKRYRNKTAVRFDDLSKYNIDPELITPELKENMKRMGFKIYEASNIEISDKSTIKTKVQETSTTNENNIIPKGIVNNRFDDLLNAIDLFTREKIIEIFEESGYSFSNQKTFIKDLKDIFHTTEQKKNFIRAIRNQISKPNKKGSRFRTIAFASGHRIIIRNNDEIDGIYNHNKYETRLKVLY